MNPDVQYLLTNKLKLFQKNCPGCVHFVCLNGPHARGMFCSFPKISESLPPLDLLSGGGNTFLVPCELRSLIFDPFLTTEGHQNASCGFLGFDMLKYLLATY